ncbi:hypothetical protein TTHERM_00112690 (macronuclear) [Tetrahymena thermophila SB210]|uniref:Uncharacterized protein n=1 Tax=Tetrahymena thermophila (strain SB210) TaxID=312017 RepID=Q22ZA2_TETTS|nr:hypothetical protein TTHERM_00112690 [Tetrahymena thermophila SB210]EAR90419.2 hypothetical protein TTHERM_00112690 [Tetrahymena thermophila SB210]|eukprot:XP_001010664.2 hypothetical protein TTHERM_00112690 [Tetrahymena thermophila SB210]
MPENDIFPNGLVFEKMFHYIWTQSDMFEQKLNVNLPQTVIFKNSLPIFWYFTDKNGQIKKKKTEKHTPENIYEVFTKKIPKCGVVAQLLYPTTCENEFNPRTNINPKGQISGLHYIDSTTEAKIRYLTEEDLAKFLNGEMQISSGVLQQFIEPATLHNDSIQVVYTPRVVLMNKRVNTKNLYNQNVDIYERCCTFDGPDYFSQNLQMSGPISKEMTEQVDRIMGHLETISYGLFNILKIHLYFKIDANRKIWFLWAGGVSMHNISDKSNSQKPQQVISQPEIQIPDIHQSVSIKRKPIQLQKELFCLKCNKKGRSVDFFELKFSDLLNEYDNTETQKITAQNPYNQNKVFGKNQREDMLGQTLTNTFMEFKQMNQTGNYSSSKKNHEEQLKKQAEKHTVYKNKEIPSFFTLLFPKLDTENFSQISQTFYFKNQKIMVCRECYLEFSSLYQKQIETFKQQNSDYSSTATSFSDKRSTNRSNSYMKFQNIQSEQKKINQEFQKKLRSLSEDKLKSNEKIQKLFKLAKLGKAEDQIEQENKKSNLSLNENQKDKSDYCNLDTSNSGYNFDDKSHNTAQFFKNDEPSSTMKTIQKQNENTIQETLKLINEIYSNKNIMNTNQKLQNRPKPYQTYKYNQIDTAKLKQKIQSAISLKSDIFNKQKTTNLTEQTTNHTEPNLTNEELKTQKTDFSAITQKKEQIPQKDISKIIATNPYKFSYYEVLKKQELSPKNVQESKTDSEPLKPRIIVRSKRAHSQINFLPKDTPSKQPSNQSSQKRLLRTTSSSIQRFPVKMISERHSENSNI